MRYRDKIWCSQTGIRLQYITAHAHCVLNNSSYRHTLRMCNTVCFTATVVTRPCVSVTLYCTIVSFVRIEVTCGHVVFPHTCYCPLLYRVDDVIACGVYAKLLVRHCAVFLSFSRLQHRRVLSTPFGTP
jgi:hypothetical protein